MEVPSVRVLKNSKFSFFGGAVIQRSDFEKFEIFTFWDNGTDVLFGDPADRLDFGNFENSDFWERVAPNIIEIFCNHQK